MCTFKNLEEIQKTWKTFEKPNGNPVFSLDQLNFLLCEVLKHLGNQQYILHYIYKKLTNEYTSYEYSGCTC